MTLETLLQRGRAAAFARAQDIVRQGDQGTYIAFYERLVMINLNNTGAAVFKGARTAKEIMKIRAIAEDVCVAGYWKPRFGMVDKDKAEINALKTSKSTTQNATGYRPDGESYGNRSFRIRLLCTPLPVPRHASNKTVGPR